jgi:glycine betaine/choline ABC-type transport system substrate-binding protein
MIDFKVDPENPWLLRTALAYDFFFDTYGLFLDAAVAAEKNDKEIVDEMKKVVNLSFAMADMFMSKVDPKNEDID